MGEVVTNAKVQKADLGLVCEDAYIMFSIYLEFHIYIYILFKNKHSLNDIVCICYTYAAGFKYLRGIM